jgi:hypothetical protein
MKFFLAAAVLAAWTGFARAQAPTMTFNPVAPAPAPAPSAPSTSVPSSSSVLTPGGAGLVAGSPGGMRTIMIPGSAVGGLVTNNGNGTSTIMIPGAPSQVVPTPR